MKAQELKTKTSAQTLIYKIFLQRYQVYQGRLLASFQDDAKYEHVGQDTRSQGGKDDQDKQGKDLKISDIKTKSKDNDKGSRSKITKHEGTSLQRRQRQRSQELNDNNNLIDLTKECHNELTSGEIKVPKERKAALITDIGTQFDLRPHMESPDWTKINAGIQQRLQKAYNTNKAAFKAQHWVIDPTIGTYNVEKIRRARPEDITAEEWDKYIQFWNDPRNIARAAQNRQNRAKSTVISRQGSCGKAQVLRSTRRSLIPSSWHTLLTGNSFRMRTDEEMRRLEATGTYTDDEINRLAKRGKQHGHIPGVGRVLPARATAGLIKWNNPKNIARAAQNRQNRAKSTVISRQGSRSLARLRDEMRQSSGTQEYPSLIDTFFVAHTVNGEFLQDEDRRIYEEMRRLEATGTYTDDEINRLARRGKQRGHIPGVGRVLPARATAGPSTPASESTLNSLHKKVDFMMSLFKSDSKYSDMFSQFESGGASGSGGCGDDEESADDQEDEDEDGDGDS
ncbi:F-box domain containing protein [Tanacetum coccineum]